MVYLQLWDWLSFLLQFSYLGVFLISLVGSMSIIIPIPYTIVIITLATQRELNPFLIAVAAGLGAGVGEFSGYILGYYGRAVINEDRQRKMKYIVQLFDRYGPIMIFLFALTPLPDDLLFVPLGILRYKLLRVLIPSLLGKLVMSLILAYGGRLYSDTLMVVFGEGGWPITVFTAILLTLIIWAMLKIDWEKIFEKSIS